MKVVTGLGRPIDFRYPSNRYVVIVTFVAGAVALAATSDGRLRTAFAVAGSAFLGWALARELDPDRTITAAVVAPIAAIVAWIDAGAGHQASLGTIYLILITARVIARTTGRHPTAPDLIVHVGVATWIAASSVGWVAAVALGVALVLDTRFEEPAPASQLWWGALIGILATASAGLLGEPTTWAAPTAREWVPMIVGITGALFLLPPEQVASVTDSGRRPLDPQRIFVARLSAIITAVIVALIGGAAGIAGVGAVWVTLAVGGVMRILAVRSRVG